jgi:putative inorganic carbon (HCO3(-)) transporter
LAGIALTYSRPTLLAIFVVLFFFGIVQRDKRLIAVLILLTVLSPFLAPRSVKQWAREVNYNPLRFMCNDDRIAIYRNALNMIKAKPIIGVGANTFMKNYPLYKERPEYRNIVTAQYMHVHNIYLQMAAEIGILGLGVFIWLLYRFFVAARGILKSLQDEHLEIVALSLIACIIAFLINGLTESSLYYARVAGIFWYNAGLMLGLKRLV